MSPRDTRTGGVLEDTILPALHRNGYTYQKQVNIGHRIGGGRHIVDVLVTTADERQLLVSLKWQQTSGTAEQKVPFEVICLAEAIRTSDGKYDKAYLVLGGDGWRPSLKSYYISGKLNEHLRYSDLVSIVSLEGFMTLANKRQL